MKRLIADRCRLAVLLVCVWATLPIATEAKEPEISAEYLADTVLWVLEEGDGLTAANSPIPEAIDALPGPSVEAIQGRNLLPPQSEGHFKYVEGSQVTGEAVRTKRWTVKSAPISDRSPQVKPRPWRRLAYAGGHEIPPSGLGDRMAAAVPLLRAAGRSDVYGFILMDEYLSETTQEELEALGVTVLGPHGSLYKTKLPTDLSRIAAVADLDYVEWVGFPSPQLKLSPELQDLLDERDLLARQSQIPVTINLFEPESDRRFGADLEAAGARLGKYDPELMAYRAVIDAADVNEILTLDFALYVELIQPTTVGHDQSMATIGVDYIRSSYDGTGTVLGIMDTGFMMGSTALTHFDLVGAGGCGYNFTSDPADWWNDEHGHGTHVLGTLIGRGLGDSRYRGVAPGIGNYLSDPVRAAKVWDSSGGGSSAWMEGAMDFFDDASACGGSRPHLVNMSGGGRGTDLVGTDSLSRKLDTKVHDFGQLYVVIAGNSGPGAGTIGTPGVAKNALTVGNVLDHGYLTVGDINNSSSRGPTGDGRMKPNLVAPGTVVTSAKAGTTDEYKSTSGTSMAAPHVTGLAATLMEKNGVWAKWRPNLTRAWLMATSLLHDDDITPTHNTSGGRNTYGLGRVSAYRSQVGWPGSRGHLVESTVDSASWMQYDLNIPAGTSRAVVVAAWDEPAASAGAPWAVLWDLDLWVDQGADCTPDAKGRCGEYVSQSATDNVEYLIIENPPANTYRFKVTPWNAPAAPGVNAYLAISLIYEDTTPDTSLSTTVSSLTPTVGESLTVLTKVSNPSYIASGVHLEMPSVPSGVSLESIYTTREDGGFMIFPAPALTLGNIAPGDLREAVWYMRATTTGAKALEFRSWSENGGTRTASVVVNPVAPGPLRIRSYTVDDDNIGESAGNGNGLAECGETIELYVELRNAGAGIAFDTVADISTTDPHASLLNNTSANYGDIAAGAAKNSRDDFDIELDPAMPAASDVTLDFTITATNGGPWNRSLNLPVTCTAGPGIFADGFESGDTSAWSNYVP